MIWHILGAGSLGCLWASRLQLAGQENRLIVRSGHLQLYQEQGSRIHFTDRQQTRHLLPIRLETAQTPGLIQHLLLACKAHAAAEAIASVRHRLAPDANLLLLQNGIGSQQEVAAMLPTAQVWLASSTEGAYMSSPFHCVHAGTGQTLIGPFKQAPAPSWLGTLATCGIPCQWQPDILPALWLKLAINCLINPLTVIHTCRNGDLRHHLGKIELLSAELAALLQAAGYPVTTQHLFNTVQQVIRGTADNTSSMLQDVQQGRRTEISYITGFALQQSRALHTPHQQLLALHQRLQAHLAQQGLPTD